MAQLVIFLDATADPNRSASEIQYVDGRHEVFGRAFLNQEVTFSIPFAFGLPIELRTELRAIADAGSQLGGDSITDLEHNPELERHRVVNDSPKIPLSGYTVSSTSGTNYLRPIPEPASAALTNFGAATALFPHRRATLGVR